MPVGSAILACGATGAVEVGDGFVGFVGAVVVEPGFKLAAGGVEGGIGVVVGEPGVGTGDVGPAAVGEAVGAGEGAEAGLLTGAFREGKLIPARTTISKVFHTSWALTAADWTGLPELVKDSAIAFATIWS